MAKYRITCIDCGSTATMSRRNAKRCRACRVINELHFVLNGVHATEECSSCNADFSPLQRGDTLCGKCHYPAAGVEDVSQSCVLCGRGGMDDPGPDHDVIPRARQHYLHDGVCMPCSKDPAMRGRFLLRFEAARKRRRRASGWTAPRADPHMEVIVPPRPAPVDQAKEAPDA